MSKAGKKIMDGLEQAANYARVTRAIRDWIDGDLPTDLSDRIDNIDISKLADRILNSKTSTGRFQFQVDGRSAGPVRDTWVDAAMDAVDAGYGTWLERGVTIKLSGDGGAAIARLSV